MKKIFKGRFLKIAVLGIVYGVVLLIIRFAFDISEENMNFVMLISGAFIIIAAVSVNIIYHVYYEKKMFRLMSLFEKGEIDAYIAEMEKLENKLGKTKYLCAYIRLNLSAGYLERKEYEKAEDILKELDFSKQKFELEAVRRINLCISLYNAGKYEELLSLYEDSEKYTEKLRKLTKYNASIDTLELMVLTASKKYGEAIGRLPELKEKYTAKRYQTVYEEIENELQKHTEKNNP